MRAHFRDIDVRLRNFRTHGALLTPPIVSRRSTKMNEASSRSHAIFTITATVTNGKKMETGKVRLSTVDWPGPTYPLTPPLSRSPQLHIVDLAGSERSEKTTDLVSTFKLKDSFAPVPRRKSESVDINLSLHYLQRVVGALQVDSPHVPYRNSVMTQILKGSLGGNSNTIFIGTLSLKPTNSNETLSTLKFLVRCGQVEVKYGRNVTVGKSRDDLQAEIKEVRTCEF